MIPQNKAYIFLAGKRKINECNTWRSFESLDTESAFCNESAFCTFKGLSDIVLAAKSTFTISINDDSEIILLPVVGAVVYSDSAGNFATVEVGEIQRINARANTVIELKNHFESELTNFLVFRFQDDKAGNSKFFQTTVFDTEKRNELIELSSFLPQSSYKLWIGKFTGRSEALHVFGKQSKGLLAFVIEGAFEIQYRLLEARDGLIIWDVDNVEIEALSNEAIILLVEK